MSEKYHRLVDDHAQLMDTIHALRVSGYVPVRAGFYSAGSSDTRGKGWSTKFRGQSMIERDTPDDLIYESFESTPSCGLSIVGRVLKGYPDLNLLIIDQDVDDPELIRRIAAIFMDSPTPIRVGKKGCAAFATYRGRLSPSALAEERGIENFKVQGTNSRGRASNGQWAGDTEIWSPMHGAKAFELIGPKEIHALIPPTLHVQAGKPYEWIPNPITGETIRLQDVTPDKLPECTPARLLLLMLSVVKGASAIWDYLGNTDEGDHHDKANRAIMSLVAERFTAEEVEEICAMEARRTAGDDHKFKERMEEIRKSIKSAIKKSPTPSPRPRAGRGPKVPVETLMTNHLIGLYDPDDLALFNGAPYQWRDGRWLPMTDPNHPEPRRLFYGALRAEFTDATSAAMRAAVQVFISQIECREANTDENLIPFRNGVLDVRKQSLRPEVREDYIVESIDYDYDPTAKCPTWENFISDLLLPSAQYKDDEDVYAEDHRLAIDVMEEFLGYCLTRSYQQRKMLLLIGRTSTGKSVLTKVVQGLLPQSWVTEVAFERFGEPNSLRRMVNAHINISSETGRQRVASNVDDLVLRITSNEKVEVKTLYENSVDVRLPARLMVNGNMPPDFNDSTGAIEKRLLYLSSTDIQPTRAIPQYEKILLKEAPGILNRLVRAYGRLLTRPGDDFVLPTYSRSQASEATKDANSVAAWLNRCTRPADDKKSGTTGEDLYGHYSEWCELVNMKPFNMVQWEKIMAGMGLKTERVRLPGNNFARLRPIVIIGGKETF